MYFFRKYLKAKFIILFIIFSSLFMNVKSAIADDVTIPKKIEIRLFFMTGHSGFDSQGITTFYRIIKKENLVKIIKFEGDIRGGKFSYNYDNGGLRYLKTPQSSANFTIIELNISSTDFIKIWKTILLIGLKNRQFDWGWSDVDLPGYLTISIPDTDILPKKTTVTFSLFPIVSLYDFVTERNSTLSDYFKDKFHANKLLNYIENAQKQNLVEKKYPENKSEVISILSMLYNTSPSANFKDTPNDTFVFKNYLIKDLEYFGISPEGSNLVIKKDYLNMISHFLNVYIESYETYATNKFLAIPDLLKEKYKINPEDFSSRQDVDDFLLKKKEDFKQELLKTYTESSMQMHMHDHDMH